ncbi:bifunctional indole-3-glycerol phosphate synthase/phosphoribosylanthranilate isomerase [Treponema brennaborense]|uniref:N-(5'-phosphoribosyl)anthranilate isomerase n=1 Tax=Treponema brennaborense (strain DSM 12168 / CIP 105900 / DD5/3) TaxID=906968 RepID=F4LPQ1_TREBD|nr:bifunctional indole-3-glycerol phosphate synthase/phosphoribosylanthranilate isomerase [Treponema brennaborense]AEE17047.1 Indole-3-glycerol-phosphate synthase., Phosphoribosylanthranilate isomerase [Treponema brennaborense DSM 12168]
MPDILAEIVARRARDLETLGATFGSTIPECRQRPIVPFLARPGTILEIKRASPSKGNIAPELNAAETARLYADAGTQAISVLTERNFFGGSLADLTDAARAAPRTAILRKDFILRKDEIGVSFRAGADAVLLIARILSAEKLREFALECRSFGITPFIEIRGEHDIEKFREAFRACSERDGNAQTERDGATPHPVPVAGVNARDLATFATDPLVPPSFTELAPYKVVFESGIRHPAAAAFAGSMGFDGILVGEAAARSPETVDAIVKAFTLQAEAAAEVKAKTKGEHGRTQRFLSENAAFWERIAVKLRTEKRRPLIKICGLTNEADAKYAAHSGADMLGFVFTPESPRNVSAERVRAIREALCAAGLRPPCIGVITDPDSAEAAEAAKLVREGVLDALQFHGCSVPDPASETARRIACYGAVRPESVSGLGELETLLEHGQPRVLLDAFHRNLNGGTGTQAAPAIVRAAAKMTPLWLAGGITPENVSSIIKEYDPELIDVSSGTELSPGKKDYAKIDALMNTIRRNTAE